jgi:hypothetical protein
MEEATLSFVAAARAAQAQTTSRFMLTGQRTYWYVESDERFDDASLPLLLLPDAAAARFRIGLTPSVYATL